MLEFVGIVAIREIIEGKKETSGGKVSAYIDFGSRLLCIPQYKADSSHSYVNIAVIGKCFYKILKHMIIMEI